MHWDMNEYSLRPGQEWMGGEDPTKRRAIAAFEVWCPQCHGEYTHHDEVEVHARGEDEPTRLIQIDGVEGTVSDHGESTQHAESNPSERRQAVRIRCWCEMCDGTFSIETIQHKGQTTLQIVMEAERSGKTEDAPEDAAWGEGMTRPLDKQELDSLEGELRGEVGRSSDETLEANAHAGPKQPTAKQRSSLERRSGLAERDLLDLGIRLGRVGEHARAYLDRACPLAWIRRPEAGGLFELAFALERRGRNRMKGRRAKCADV